MAVVKSLQFLPEIFRTDTNRKFLNATVDQLISEPSLKKLNGYIGRKLSPAYKVGDSYIEEPAADRQNYQLEPSIVIKDPISDKITFATTYSDIINRIGYYGGITNNHSRLFDSEFYSYDPKIDLDKFINFNQYYWLENGPNSVTVTSSGVPLEFTFVIDYDEISQTYRFSGQGIINNPTITLARGGTYDFVINSPGNPFWIQSSPGADGVDLVLPSINTRNVLGVTDNGADAGVVRFTVPTAEAQLQWTSMPTIGTVDYATNLSYKDLQGAKLSDINDVLGGIDGLTTGLNGKRIIFVNNTLIDDEFWAAPTVSIVDNVVVIGDPAPENGVLVEFAKRNDIYEITVYPDNDEVDRVVLTPVISVTNEQKIRVRAGLNNAGKEYYSRLDLLSEIPLITAPLTNLYYQNSAVENAVGQFNIVESNVQKIDPATEIVGQSTYTSPNGVVFSNGLKVTFDSTATDDFANKTYYVEGVGTSIRLIEESVLVVPELDNDISAIDYLTINRGSFDQNAWSRGNRWFHTDIIQATADYNKVDAIFDQNLRAKRPIIEFAADLQLHNFGSESKRPVDILDDVITNAFLQVQGVISDSPTSCTIVVGDQQITFTSGTRVVFAADTNSQVRNKIYNFTVELTTEAPDPAIYRAYIEEASDSEVLAGHTLVVASGTNGKKQWYFNGSSWILSQQKTAVNQAPLFDVIDENGISFFDSSAYPGSTFTGTKIVSYREGTGANDEVLGFPLSYKNFVTQGDIEFVNNFDTETFNYLISGGGTKTVDINSGYLQKNITRDTSTRQNTWTIVDQFSKQFQIYSFVYDGVTNIFPVDYLPSAGQNQINIKVYVNNAFVDNANVALTQIQDRYAILINPDIISSNDSIFIKIFNANEISTNAYYETPSNLDINSLNTNLQILTLGQIRNHLVALKNNSRNITGQVPGQSNLRDVQYLNAGGTILQHSAPVIYSGLFLNDSTMNFVDSIRLASQEYSKFKNKFLELAANLNLDRNNVAQSVDTILGTINQVKNESFPYYYSDMLAYGEDFKNKIPTYTVISPAIRAYELTQIFQDKVISNRSVMVYLTRTVDNVTTQTLLVKDRDFEFSQTRSAIVFLDSFTLLYGDKIDIYEYSNTDGSYIPETPSKLGLFPKFVPEVYLDNTYRTPINVIQGHDGSITPAFNDFRDQFLLELERRIYNNIKVDYDILNFNINDYVPGKFRITDYSLAEFNQILSQGFLSWAGSNRVDFTTNNTFVASDPFTWNYRKFRDIVNGETLPGSWRSIYKYFYDTDRPHTHPWEMLGFSEKPDYWDDRYGPAPYTGGNLVLWSDLAQGYIHAGSRAGFDLRYQRLNLTEIIPVDDAGNLRSPEEFLVADFDSAKANTNFAVGDQGPVETAWRRSCEYAFTLQLALALAKPAKYFSLLINQQRYIRNRITAQFVVVTNNQHLRPTDISVNGFVNNGEIIRTAGYINWIRDYIKSLGIDNASEYIVNNLKNLNVQLAYKAAGYTDKKLINILAEQSSPSSINDSVVIPDENYRIELYKGSPVQKLTYSAVIIERTNNGYSVSGYDLSNPYFYIIPSLVNNNAYTITVGNQRGTIYKDFKNAKYVIPYGFEFNSKQQVVDFLVGYQRYLLASGFVFVDTESLLNEKKDWILSCKEFLNWVAQGWKKGSIIVVSPVSNRLKVFDENSIVDEITNRPYRSKILDINFKVITKNNFTVIRENNLFELAVNSDQTIGLAELSLIQYEHIVVFDNVTVFQDIIYAPELGNRQYRLKLVGSKTATWNGSLELPGFLYASPDVPNWNPGTDYLKGSIVRQKSQYYTALQNITASDTFQSNQWKLIPVTELRSGMINNFATNASQSLNYFDIDNQPLNENLQLFSNGLIGFRNRQYFDNLGIDTVTQSKFYQGLIKQKGTIKSLGALTGAIFNGTKTSVDFYENWAIRVGEYGAIDINKYVEVILGESAFKNNPTALQFSLTDGTSEPEVLEYTQTDLFKIGGEFNPNIFAIETQDKEKLIRPLPLAGFVNIDDVDATIFNLTDYSLLTIIVNNIGSGYKIWVAKDFNNQWNVYRANVISGSVFALRYKIDTTAEFIVSNPHNLETNDIVVIKNFDARYDGVYLVTEVIDSTRFTVSMYQNLQDLIDAEAVVGNGILHKLSSMRIDNPSLIDALRPDSGWVLNDKIWVDNLDDQENWGVYSKSDPWEYNSKLLLDVGQYTGNDKFGQAVKVSSDGAVVISGAPFSGAGRIQIASKVGSGTNAFYQPYKFLWANGTDLKSYGKAIAYGNGYLAVGAPESATNRGYAYVYKDESLIQILADPTGSAQELFGNSIDISDDGRFLYIGAPGANAVFCYALGPGREDKSQTIFADGVNDTYTLDFSASLPTDIIITLPLKAAESIPYLDYTVSQFTSGVGSIAVAGTAIPAPNTTAGIDTISYYGLTANGDTNGAKFNVTRTEGSTSYTVTVVKSGSGYTPSGTLTILGTSLGGASPANDLTITINTVKSGTDLVFDIGSIPILDERIAVFTRPQYYKAIGTLPVAIESSGTSGFGYNVTSNFDGSVISVGANKETVSDKLEAGAVYVYHKTVTNFVTNGFTNTYRCPNDLNTVFAVYVNGQELVNGLDYFVSAADTIAFLSPPSTGQTLTVETNQFIFDQKIISTDPGLYFNFGSSQAICNTGCNLIVASSGYNKSSYRYGLVTRYINIGRVYGIVEGANVNPTLVPGDTFVINNRSITVVGTGLDNLISIINGSNIPGVTASNVNGKIKLISNVQIAGEKLDIKVGSGTVLQDLGIEIYQIAQEIKHPQDTGEIFGTAVALNGEANVLIVSSEGADIDIPKKFDNGNTVFDSTSTTITDKIKDSGAVYVYDLMANPFETKDNPSLFVYSQKLVGPGLDTGFNFGAGIDIQGQVILAGATNDYDAVPTGGSVYVFYNVNQTPGWKLLRFKEPRVDIDALNTAFIYNSKTSNLITHFDFIDPVKGKLLGVVDQEIDYREEHDPAAYNSSVSSSTVDNDYFYWSDRQVGKIWWDLSQCRYIDYEQSSISYRLNNWGALFPGSKVKIYEWVESDFLPSQYEEGVGDGVPKYPDNSSYSVVTTVDPGTGVIKQKYYYWVGDKTTVDPVVSLRNISAKALEQYISNPKDQNIPYLALLKPNAVGVFNILPDLVGNNVVLHLDTSQDRNDNIIHNEYEMIKEGSSESVIPLKIINKLKDSLVGFDQQGQQVPDPLLSVQDRLGILIRPRQSIFTNRLNAVEIFTDFINNVFVREPVFLVTNPTDLFRQEPLPTSGFDDVLESYDLISYLDINNFVNGYTILITQDAQYNNKWTLYKFNSTLAEFELIKIQSYKTELFWDAVDWYSSSYISGKTINYVVNTFSDIQKLTLAVGDYVKVLENGNGQWLIYEYTVDQSFELVGAQNATLSVNRNIYDPTVGSGFDSVVFDLVSFDPQAGLELASIFDAVYGQIFVNSLSLEMNQLFFAIINYIFSEQKSPDWIFKTSFIDVLHNFRTLEQLSSYVRDSQSFYEDYISEVKPYRVKIKEYTPIYDNLDPLDGNWTDFDLPAFYDSAAGIFRSPDIVNSADAQILVEQPYINWLDNFRYGVTNFIIANPGSGYTIAPNIEISGGGGSGASAITTVNPATGKITGVTVINPGSGYTSTPSVFINGVGSGALLYPVLRNEFYNADNTLSYNTVRNITTELVFDRINYTSNLVYWQPNTAYANTVVVSGSSDPGNVYISSGNIVVYANTAFIAVDAWDKSNLSVFDYTLFTKIDSGNSLLKATDRIMAYYSPTVGMPGKDYDILMAGIEYPGVQVKGPEFRANAFEITSNVISFSTTNLSVTSANVSQVNFLDLGFEVDYPVRIEALVPFPFVNNGRFNIVTVSSDSMTITGQPIEPLYKVTFGSNLTLESGDFITQTNTSANAYVLNSTFNSNVAEVVYIDHDNFFIADGSNVATVRYAANGLVKSTANITFTANTGATTNVRLSYQNLFDEIDANVYSTFLDTELGTRPEDINISGGAYVDTYSSHAPEELVPGRVYDALEMRVFTNNASNTETYGFRIFKPMSGNLEFTRISSNATTTLSTDLLLTDRYISVVDASKLPAPSPETSTPGIVFVNGEKIHYYRRYDDATVASAVPWAANTVFARGSLITADIGVEYLDINSNVAGVNFDVTRYNSSYVTKINVASTTETISVGNAFVIYGNLLGGIYSTNDAVVDVVLTGNANTIVTLSTTGTPAAPQTTVYYTIGNVYANANSYINVNNVEQVFANTLAQIRRGVDGTGAANIHVAGSMLVDSSIVQVIPDSEVYSNTIANIYTTGNANVTSNVSWKLTLSSNITVVAGDYITQFVGNTGNARVLGNVTSGNVVAVEFVTGNLLLASNIGTRINVASISSAFNFTTANVVTIQTLGSVNANGNIGSSQISAPGLRSNLWIPYGTGIGLENSTLAGAEFIRLEPSYTP